MDDILSYWIMLTKLAGFFLNQKQIVVSVRHIL